MMVSNYALGTIALLGGTACYWMYIKANRAKFEQIKHTNCYKETLAALRSHHGAIKYLGEPIKEMDLLVTDIREISDEIKRTEVYVPVKGPEKCGVLYFYVNQYINNPENFYVDNIELQIGNDTSRRLVIQKSKLNNVTEKTGNVEMKSEEK